MTLGARFDAQSSSSRGYQCSPSEQFPEFTRCQRVQRQQTSWGRRGFDSISSILHSGDGKAVYINHYVAPWIFDRNEIQTEINRLSGRFGERAREMRMPQREGLPSGIIASWGQVALEQLDADAVSVLASGQSPRKGLLIDYLGDLRRSAQLGLPIYSIHGGAGYVWSASAERGGRGHIRALTVDASAFTPATEKPQPSPEANTQANAAETIVVQTPQAQPAAVARAEPEKATADTELAKTEVENAPVAESAAADTTEAEQPAKVEALVARLEAQLARVEAANRKLETWGYRAVAGLVLFLIAAAVMMRAWRRKARATAAPASKAKTQPKMQPTSSQPVSSSIAVPQAVPQSAGPSAPSLVPADPSPLPSLAEMQGTLASPAPRTSSVQPCTSCQGEIAHDDKFCKHCGTAVAAASPLAVASPSMGFNGGAH
jgi:hypothetical protein